MLGLMGLGIGANPFVRNSMMQSRSEQNIPQRSAQQQGSGIPAQAMRIAQDHGMTQQQQPNYQHQGMPQNINAGSPLQGLNSYAGGQQQGGYLNQAMGQMQHGMAPFQNFNLYQGQGYDQYQGQPNMQNLPFNPRNYFGSF